MTESVTIADEPRTSAVGRNQLLDHVFLAGLAGVFIVNAAVALVHPHGEAPDLAATSLVPVGARRGHRRQTQVGQISR